MVNEKFMTYVYAIFMHIYVLNNIALLNQLLWGDIKYRVGNDTMRFQMGCFVVPWNR